ncbi:MAG: hypothetical protein KVP17_003763 [Porospora cf. gigantea B]|uniref:uncharacterized protein n=1 Tax=Porospora cf. gigantea B TaxID=2853592 RepID=UPI00357195E0|nr:MAG: hypothetical protein KVP17_003763 [Porospora cf. gigantea B]
MCHWSWLALAGLGVVADPFDNFQLGNATRPLHERKVQFLDGYPGYNQDVEAVREKEARRLDDLAYLDYAGSGQYQDFQLRKNYEDLTTNAYGNAHSHNPSAEQTDSRLRQVRQKILDWFGVTAEEYTVIFTSGATAALKLVGETFEFKGGEFWYTRSNHNSVLGIREFAHRDGAPFKSLSRRDVEDALLPRLNSGARNGPPDGPRCLFAYPLKDNFAGDMWPARWAEQIRSHGLSDDCHWTVLADVAAFVSSTPLSLREFSVDYAALSFYKMFGYPTGLGCLLVRNGLERYMSKVYWGGGTVITADCDSRWCKMKGDTSSRFEDGTVSFLAINSLRYGFEALESLGGMQRITQHIAALTRHLSVELDSMRYFGRPVVTRYTSERLSPASNGIIAFNLHRPDGSTVNFSQIEMMASHYNIHLRGGCFCNPGACQDFLELTTQELVESSETRQSCSDPHNAFGKPLGAVRVSIGYLTTFEDVELFLDFLRGVI